MAKAVQASKDHFSEMAGRYVSSHGGALDFPTVTRIAQGLMCVSAQRATNYLNGYGGPADTLCQWVKVKETLDTVVAELSSRDPSVRALFSMKPGVFPNQLERALVQLREVAAAEIYSNLNTPFSKKAAFEAVRSSVQALQLQYGPQLTAHATTLGQLKAFKPEPAMQSALEMITEPAEGILSKIREGANFTFEAAIPVNAMLYLLTQVKDPAKRNLVVNAIRQYEAGMREALEASPRASASFLQYGTLVKGRISAAVAAVAV